MFSEFLTKFEQFKKDSRLSTGGDELGWKVSKNVASEFKKDIDLTVTVGQKLLGIRVLEIIDRKSDTIALLKIDSIKLNKTVKDMFLEEEISLNQSGYLKCPVTERGMLWPTIVKKRSVKITDSYENECVDEDDKIMTVRNNGVSLRGFINYDTGILELVRIDEKNIELFEKMLLETPGAGTGTGGGSSSGSSGTGEDENTVPPEKRKKSTDNIKITADVYGGKITKIWEYKKEEERN